MQYHQTIVSFKLLKMFHDRNLFTIATHRFCDKYKRKLNCKINAITVVVFERHFNVKSINITVIISLLQQTIYT